jgi:hypothetical protein
VLVQTLERELVQLQELELLLGRTPEPELVLGHSLELVQRQE